MRCMCWEDVACCWGLAGKVEVGTLAVLHQAAAVHGSQ